MRILKTLYETFQRLKSDAFKEWLREEDLLETLMNFIESFGKSSSAHNRG